ncbi:MAG: UDP-N-acetylmuramate dehydrogenase [Candidatus Aminicenantes bacterium]|nr:UDP-N-acetylmuramate dehydrogenase [Candidatus Aminicenantes bacterium]
MFSSLTPWLREQRLDFHENIAIGSWLHFKIGGKVSLLVTCNSPAQLTACLKKVIVEKIPYLLIGGGSNIVFSDGLTRAVVLLYQGTAKKTAAAKILGGRALQVDGHVKNQLFLSWCAAHGVGGLEFLSGIPGTMGGAAAVNAGAFGQSLADVLLGADIVDKRGNMAAVDAGYFAFTYRGSRFKLGNEAIVSLRLKFHAEKKRVVAGKIKANLEYRLANHPSYRLHSAGCFFKNPLIRGAKQSAGQIIETCGLKGLAVGGMSVADTHANFLIHSGGATFKELERLEQKIKTAVKARTGISLEREVIYVSARGEKY